MMGIATDITAMVSGAYLPGVAIHSRYFCNVLSDLASSTNSWTTAGALVRMTFPSNSSRKETARPIPSTYDVSSDSTSTARAHDLPVDSLLELLPRCPLCSSQYLGALPLAGLVMPLTHPGFAQMPGATSLDALPSSGAMSVSDSSNTAVTT